MTAQITPLQFNEWGYEASSNFLSEGVPMNKMIVKIATDNDLSPVQIQRICEIANHCTYSQMIKSSEDKTFEFPLAKSDEIMDFLKEEPEKTSSDYSMPPRSVKLDVDSNKLFGFTSISNVSEVEEAQKIAKQTLTKIAAAREELEGRIVVNTEGIKNTENLFYKQAKEMILTESATFRDIATSCLGVWEDDKREGLITKTAMRLAHEGVLGAKMQYMAKNAEAVNDSLISKNLSALTPVVGTKVINGNHPLMATINTLSDKYKDGANLEESITVLDERSRLVKTRIEDLNTSKKVDDHIQNEV